MRKLLHVLPAVLMAICQAVACAADEPQAATGFDDRAFGRLPVLFNGRVTDFDDFARSALLRISGRETWRDAEGKSQPAVAWLLDLVCGDDAFQSAAVVLVEHPHLRRLFELPPDAKAQLISLKDLIPKLETLSLRIAEVRQSQTPRTDDERAVLEFELRLQFLKRLMVVFRRPDFTNGDSMLQDLRESRDMEQQAIPFAVPPKEPGGQWLTWTFALIEAHVAQESGIEANPAGVQYVKLVAARRDRDPATFNVAVRELSLLIKQNDLANCPLTFKAPRGWVTEGTLRLDKQHYFGDTRAWGTTLTTYYRFDGLDTLMMHVNFFPQGATRKEQIVNSWRMSKGRAPLPLNEIRTTPFKVLGQTGWRVDIESPDDLPVESDRMSAVGVSLGEQTWVITCSGPKPLMAKHVADFDQFVRSITVTSPEAMENWLALPMPEPIAESAGTKLVLAVVPDKQAVWMLQGTYFAEQTPAEQIEKLRSIIKSIRFDAKDTAKDQDKRRDGRDEEPAARLPFTWTLPEGWQLDKSPEGRLRVVSRNRPAFVALEILPLKLDGELSLPVLIEQWRAEYRLPPLPLEKISANVETMTVGNRKIALIVQELP